MEHRRLSGNSHWYHETQSCRCSAPAPSGDSSAAADAFLLDLNWSVPPQLQEVFHTARHLGATLFPQHCPTSLTHTLSLYDRLSTALTVAQVAGVQRLCNHYATRLYPLSSTDSSRESNNRLTQMTQFARQLAMQPSLIDGDAMAALDAVGLTEPDIVTLCQIVGFISYQARVVAGVQALNGLPVRWLPGLSAAPDADEQHPRAACTLNPVTSGYATPEQQQAVRFAATTLSSETLRWRLAHDASALSAWCALHQQLETLSATALVMAVTARLNGNRLTAAAPPDATLTAETENGLIQLATQLTRLPATFSAAHLQTLKEQGFDEPTLALLIQHVALANWDDRLLPAFTD